MTRFPEACVKAPGRRRHHLAVSVVVTLLCAASGTHAEEPDADVKRYCSNIAKAAGEARFQWQSARLNALEARIKDKAKELDARTAALRDWVSRREALEKKAAEKLVGIYAKMRPEIAATQIAELDDDMAAAILGQLNARQASAIFNELVPERAGKLAALIAGTGPASEKPAIQKTAAADKSQ